MTVTQINELKAARAKSIAEARKIHEAAATTKRAFTTEEQAAYDGHMADEARAKSTIEREERLAGLEPEHRKEKSEAETPEIEGNLTEAQRSEELRKAGGKRATPDYRAAFNKWLRRGRGALTETEFRDLSADSDADGGYLIAPQVMVGELLKNLDDTVYVRQKARKFQLVKAKSLGVIKRTAKMSTWARGGEITPPTKDTSLKYGKRELHPQYMSGLALVSRDLINNSSLPPDQLVREEMAINAGEVQEAEFMTGSGAAGSALGVFTASNDGISTGRDFATGNAATAIGADGLFEAKYGLKEVYRRGAEWMFSRTAVKQIAKLKDGNGQYLWEPSLKAGEADRILGLPYVESEYVPNTFTTGLYVGILANWRFYWIADALDMEIQVLKELYALSNQDGYVARLKMDAAPQLEEAFARVKLG
jgi:HK97 family phage major capsid protein